MSHLKQLRSIPGFQRDSNPWPLRSRCSAKPAPLPAQFASLADFSFALFPIKEPCPRIINP